MAELVKDKQKLQEILLHHVATADQGEYELELQTIHIHDSDGSFEALV